jgi:DNA-directed RNA polymerase subunit RPC12/RpoP
MKRTRIGKCSHCKIAFTWDEKLGNLKDVGCPSCKGPLKQTTYLLKWPKFEMHYMPKIEIRGEK